MPDFYYMDLYFDPDETGLGGVIDGCVSAFIESGFTFERIGMPSQDMLTGIEQVKVNITKLEDLSPAAAEYAERMERLGKLLIAFPPMGGRIYFRHDLAIDHVLSERIREEEFESDSSARSVGLSFMYSTGKGFGRKIAARISLWEEFLLTKARADICIGNMRRILDTIGRIGGHAAPYFGAMNTELHLNTDKSLELLLGGRLPEGNEFVIVGRKLMDALDVAELNRRKLQYKGLASGGVVIQFADKWKGETPLK